MKKGQVAITVILFIILAMFLIYILWVTPSERMNLLGLNETDNDNTTNGQIAEENNTVFSVSVGYIGKRTGALIEQHKLDGMQLFYPAVEESVDGKKTAVLTANVLFNGELKTVIPGDYSFVTVTTVIGNVVGTPKLEITSGKTVLYSGEIAKNQEINFKIDESKISGDIIEISCQWHGLAFWTQQSCELIDLEIIKTEFKEVNPDDTRQIILSEEEINGGTYQLSFRINEAVNNNTLLVILNNVQIYEDSPENRTESYNVKGAVGSVDLVEGSNLMQISSAPGSSYSLTNITFGVYEKVLEESNVTYYFNVPSEVYLFADKFLVSMTVQEITERGGLDIIFNNIEYYLAPSTIVTGENWFDIKVEDLNSGANKLRISSSTGRFRIGNFKVIWE